MILFSSPKPFTSETLPVQLTAIRSWKRALPGARVILYGNEPGLDEVCRQEQVEFGGRVEADPAGFKIISGMFRRVHGLAPGETSVFLNSDILLDESIRSCVPLLEAFPGPFLGTARRRCLPAWSGPALAGAALEEFLVARRQPVRWGDPCALDIFLFRNFPVDRMPEFRIGQAAWDNWMIFHARLAGIPAVDLSRGLRPFHCDHDYSYVRENPDPQRSHAALNQVNLALLGGDGKKFHMGHCDYEFERGRIQKRRGPAFRLREFEFLRLRRPKHEVWIRPLRALTRPLLRCWERRASREEDWNR